MAKECENTSPKISEIISNSFYIDDLLTGADTIEDLIEIQRDISKVLSSAGLDLRKWLCNDQKILHQFSINEDLPASVLHIGENENNKTLGVFWNSVEDYIQYSICDFQENVSQITKRKILSMVCQIYDPLGLLGPVILLAKLFIQELWKLEISWDENVPDGIRKKWLDFQNDLKLLNILKIPRHVCFSSYLLIELHGFADASEKAFGCCIFIRCVNLNNFILVNLLCSKSRVAPIKQPVSLPRLELSACVLLANLTKKTTDALKINFNNLYFWTDSSVTLAWLKGDITRWKTFVANRVSEIITLTNKNDWYHINTKENPADLISRGCSSNILCENKLWWYGPQWLKMPKHAWNISKINMDFVIPEQRSSASLVVNIKSDNVFIDLIKKYSSLTKLLRVMSFILRFIQNCKDKMLRTNNKTIVLKPNEIENSLLILIKLTQIQHFSEEYNSLLVNKPLNKRSDILCLNPFLHNSVIRVGGRLTNLKTEFDKKHQIILPKNNTLTDLIIINEHVRLLHCGVQQMICSLREKFWPLSARNACKKIAKNCIICFRAKPTNTTYLMGDLPDARISMSPAFTNVGIDYGGPFMLKDRSTRGAKIIKAYICLIVCMCTKAVHLELVTDLTTSAFLNTIKRFISRRGLPNNIYSDNGRNFVGANTEIQKLYDFLERDFEVISNDLANQRIKWHFIPARSPSFGGLWEAGIKRVKFHLCRILGNNSFTFEHFSTLLTEVEGILNSRPLTPLTSDPDDLNVLTPAHFLIGRSLKTLPEPSIVHLPENRLDKYQRLSAAKQHFWNRWNKEYLNDLQVRSKWRYNSGNITIGSMVLLKDENIPSFQWQIGRIVQLYPGQDNIVRVVDVKVSPNKVLRRAVTKLCLLPIETEH